jgi:putative endonuclease
MPKSAYVYILASRKHGTLYTGVTNDLMRRMYEHKHHLIDGFTSKYDVTNLVWFEQGEDIAAAITLEKKIKNRNRKWKIDLIEKNNPDWVDLSANWMDSATTGANAPFAQNDGEYEL